MRVPKQFNLYATDFYTPPQNFLFHTRTARFGILYKAPYNNTFCVSRIGLDDAKRIVVTRLCMSVCLSVCPRPYAHTTARTRM